MCWRKVAMSDYTTFFAPARPAKRFQNLCSRSSTGRAALQLDYLSVSVALKGHGFSHAVVSVESWASAPEGSRTSSQHRSPSVACMLTSRGKEGWSDRRLFRGGRSVARLATCESLGFRLAPRPLLHKAGENRRLAACMFKLDRRRYRVGEPEPA